MMRRPSAGARAFKVEGPNLKVEGLNLKVGGPKFLLILGLK